MTNLITMARRAGFLLPKTERSIWIHGESRAEYDAARGCIRSLRERLPWCRWVFTSVDPEMLAWLRDRYVDDVVCPAPVSFAGGVRRFFRRYHPCGMLILGSAKGLPEEVFAVAKERGILIMKIEANGITENGATALEAVVAPDMASRNGSLLIPTIRDRIGEGKIWRVLAARWWTRKRIDDWEQLGQRLGHPQTILCLGNGPSSEDPAVLAQPYDVLFRVNHLWQQRGLLTNPDIVFVGAPGTMKKVRPCIYGFSTVRKEFRMLLRHLWSCGPQPVEYITLERLTPLAGERRWNAELTTGAYMIMAAAGLRPKRLIIAGIDLYLHPQGRYPGNAHANNTYAPDHNRNTELEAIAETLRSFPNEIVIVGDILRDSLARML
jgi:hypothetical protein